MRVTVVDSFQKPAPKVKIMMYGGSRMDHTAGGTLFRIQRAYPFLRAGQLVAATPQFKAQTLYSFTSGNAKLPGGVITPVSIRYPFKTK